MSAFLDGIGFSDEVMLSTLAHWSLGDWLAGVILQRRSAPSESIAEMRPALVRMYTVVRAHGSHSYAADARRFIAATAICEQLVSPGSSGVAVTEVPPVRRPRTKSRGSRPGAHRAGAQVPHGIQAMEKVLHQRWLVRLALAPSFVTRPCRVSRVSR